MDNLTLHVETYLHLCRNQKKLDTKTLKAYKIDLRQFSEFLSRERKSISKESVLLYIMEMNSKYKPRSVKRKIASLKAFLGYLEDDELLEHNPFNKIKVNLREPVLLPRTIPLKTIEKLLAFAYSTWKTGDTPNKRRFALRDVAVMELLFATGLRVSELCNLDVSNIDLEEGNIVVYGKGSKERIVQVGSTSVLSVLNEYYQCFGGKEYGPFFLNRSGRRLSEQSVRSILKKYSDMISTNIHITPHMFRHSFATFLLEEDVDIRYIQQILGHSSITTTQIYTHVATEKQKYILTNKHPRNKMSF